MAEERKREKKDQTRERDQWSKDRKKLKAKALDRIKTLQRELAVDKKRKNCEERGNNDDDDQLKSTNNRFQETG